MAKSVSVDLLQYYDTKIKKWVEDKINDNTVGTVIFLDKSSFPSTGKENTLYVNTEGLYIWDKNLNKYVSLSSQGGSSETLKWGSF